MLQQLPPPAPAGWHGGDTSGRANISAKNWRKDYRFGKMIQKKAKKEKKGQAQIKSDLDGYLGPAPLIEVIDLGGNLPRTMEIVEEL